MSFRFNVVRQPVVRTNVVHVTVGVRKLLSGGAKRMKRCVLYCVLYICLQNEYKTIWGKGRVRGNGKNAYAQCTNMQVNVENTFKKIKVFLYSIRNVRGPEFILKTL